MDPFSQAALGAVVGQATGHARLGYRAAAIGALAGAVPDIDVLFSIGGDYFDQLELHRGITHSLFFAPVVGPLAGLAVWRWESRGRSADTAGDRGRLLCWIAVITLALWSHPLLDLLTPYGTQLLLPFSDQRFAINAMPIIDPLFTLSLVSGLLIAGRFMKRRAQAVALCTLLISAGYLAYAWQLNIAAEKEAIRQLNAQGIRDVQVAAFPTLLQVHYRRVVVRTADVDRVGYLSMWQPCDIAWQQASRIRTASIVSFLATREGHIFSWFTMGWIRYHLEQLGDEIRLRATDLRYGFDENPDRSIFSASVRLNATGGLLGKVVAGRNAVDGGAQRLAGLFEDTYAPLCRLTLR